MLIVLLLVIIFIILIFVTRIRIVPQANVYVVERGVPASIFWCRSLTVWRNGFPSRNRSLTSNRRP